MHECGLASRQPIKHRYQANEDNSLALPNLLNRQFNLAGLFITCPLNITLQLYL